MPALPDDNLLQQLKNEDSASFKQLYKTYFPSIALYVKQNMGNTADAEDIFQEAILVLVQKVRQPQFTLTSSLKTYLYAIAKNLWLKRLRDNKLILDSDFESIQHESETFAFELTPEQTPDEKVKSWLTRITENCQRVLRAIFFLQEPIEDVMKKMGWKNKHVAANQQYKCLEQVRREKVQEEGIEL
jgi:RNA polymerase sigma factor (sigma-70 family)